MADRAAILESALRVNPEYPPVADRRRGGGLPQLAVAGLRSPVEPLVAPLHAAPAWLHLLVAQVDPLRLDRREDRRDGNHGNTPRFARSVLISRTS